MRPEQAGPRLLEALVNAYSPSGREEQAAQALATHLEDWGLDVRRDEAGNVIARRPQAEADPQAPTVLLVGHIDTVPGRLPVEREGEILHGRGAIDAKGPLTAHALALATLPDDVELDVRLVAAVGEEVTSRGARHVRGELDEPEAFVVAEPTGLETIGLGYKGRLVADVTAVEERSHAGEPSPTAAERVLEAVETLTERTDNPERDVGFEDTTVRVTELSTDANAETELACARLDVRFPDRVPDLGAAEATLPATVEVDVGDTLEGVRADPRNPLATSMRAALRKAGLEPRAAVKTGTSDWNVLAESWNCPAVAYGPGDPELDHSPYERIDVREVVEASGVLRAGLERFAAQQSR